MTPARRRDPELARLWAGGVAADHGSTTEDARRPGPDPDPGAAALTRPGNPVRVDRLVEHSDEIELSLHPISRPRRPRVAGTAARGSVVALGSGSGEVGDRLGNHRGVEDRLRVC